MRYFTALKRECQLIIEGIHESDALSAEVLHECIGNYQGIAVSIARIKKIILSIMLKRAASCIQRT